MTLPITFAESARQTSVNGLSEGVPDRVACRLPSCKQTFVKNRKDKVFCSNACKLFFHKLEYAAGKKVLSGGRGIHFARVAVSERLQRVLAVLKRGGWYSTFELNIKARVTSAGTAISELERNGYEIYHRRMSNSRAFEYCLRSEPHDTDRA